MMDFVEASTIINEERSYGIIGQKPPIICSITMAQSARQREKAGKLYPPAIQRLVSLQSNARLYSN
jgi:hypothetical protein